MNKVVYLFLIFINLSTNGNKKGYDETINFGQHYLFSLQRRLHHQSYKQIIPYDYGYMYGYSSFVPTMSYSYSKYGYSNASFVNSLHSFLGGEFSSLDSSGNGIIGSPDPQKCLTIDLYNSYYKFFCYDDYKEKINFYSYDYEDKEMPWVTLYYNLSYEEEIEKDLKSKLTYEQIQKRKHDNCKCSLNNYRLIADDAEMFIYVDKNYKFGNVPKNPMPPKLEKIGTERNILLDDHLHEVKMDTNTRDALKENKINTFIYNGKLDWHKANEYLITKIRTMVDYRQTKDKDKELNKEKDIKDDDKDISAKKDVINFINQKDVNKEQKEIQSNNLEYEKNLKYNKEIELRRFKHKNIENIKLTKKLTNSKIESIIFNMLTDVKTNPSKKSFISISSKIRHVEQESNSYVNYDKIPMEERMVKNYVNMIDNHVSSELKDLRDDSTDMINEASMEQETNKVLGFRIRIPKRMRMSVQSIYRYIRSWKQNSSYNCDWKKLEIYDYLLQMLNDKELMYMAVTLVFDKVSMPLNEEAVRGNHEKWVVVKYWIKVFQWNIHRFRKYMEYNKKCLYIMDSQEYLYKLYRNYQKYVVTEEELEKT